MATKFTQLPAAGSITGAEILAVVQGGASKQATASDIVNALLAAVSGAANGVAPLDANSKIPTANLPALAVTSVNVVNSEAAQLALTAQEGDVAIRTDISTTYLHNGGSAGDMTDWTQWLMPAPPVQSVNGQTGTIVLADGDVNAVPDTAPGAADGIAQLDAAQQVVLTQRRRKSIDLGTLSGNVDIDLSAAEHFRIRLGGNLNITWINLPPTGYIADPELVLTQDTDTIYTVAFSTAGDYAGDNDYPGPAIAGQTDIVGYEVASDGTWVGFQVEAA